MRFFFYERPSSLKDLEEETEHLKDKDVTDDCREENLPDITVLMLKWTHRRLWQQAEDFHRFNLDNMAAQRRGSGHKSSSLTKDMYATDTCLERENGFLQLNVTRYVYQPHPRISPMPRSSWPIQDGHHFVVVVCVMYFYLFLKKNSSFVFLLFFAFFS